MTLIEETQVTSGPVATPGGCPVDHKAFGYQKAGRSTAADDGAPAVERAANGTWHVRGFEEARVVLRGNATTQAGFRAELVTKVRGLINRPVLFQDGKVHQEQRAKTARFFTPKTVSANYRQLMEAQARTLIAGLLRERRVDLSALSLTMAVQVAAQVIGLTESRLGGLTRRLDAFFEQPSTPSRAPFVARLHEILNLRRTLLFYTFDVRPAIRARRQEPREDVISHLLAQDYSDSEILIECITFGAAGMATTREFISMAAWHMLEHPALKTRYLAAPETERVDILHELLRLEPVVGHLFRRATADITLTSEGREVVIPEGALIDLAIDAANVDPRVVDPDTRAVCPARPIHADRVGAMLLSFGDGAHRCPGAYIAIQETDIFLRRLLAIPDLRIEREPALAWNELTQAYELRRFWLTLDPA